MRNIFSRLHAWNISKRKKSDIIDDKNEGQKIKAQSIWQMMHKLITLERIKLVYG